MKASYKYQAEDVDELNFEVGEIIQVVEYDDTEDQVWKIFYKIFFSLWRFFGFLFRRKGGSWVWWKAQVKKECFQLISLGQCEKKIQNLFLVLYNNFY